MEVRKVYRFQMRPTAEQEQLLARFATVKFYPCHRLIFTSLAVFRGIFLAFKRPMMQLRDTPKSRIRFVLLSWF